MVVIRLLVSLLALTFTIEGTTRQDFESSFKPIEIHVVYMDIPEGVAEAASFIRDRGFPHLIRQLSQILTVRRMRHRKIRILHRSQIEGLHDPIEFGGTDLVVFVRVKNLSAGHFMASRSIQYDSLGRPTVGLIEISFSSLLNGVQDDPPGVWRSRVSEGLFHEMIHILGFAYSQLSSFRNPKSLTLRIPDSKRIFYTCSIDRETKRAAVEWDIDPRGGIYTGTLFSHEFLPGIVEAIDARGLKAKDCRCPLDSTRQYSKADIEHCINVPTHCAVAVVTETVALKTREYYACSSARGMELENAASSRASCRLWFSESHWKMRLARRELMTFRGGNPSNGFIAPFTWALLEDSGWYGVVFPKAEETTSWWGHLKGCSFLLGDCINAKQNWVVDKDSFCIPRQNREYKCSKNALSIEACSATISLVKLSTEYDNCPVFDDLSSVHSCLDYPTSSGAIGHSGPDSRCFMLEDDATCLRVKCAENGKSYRFQAPEEPGNTFTCYGKGPILFQSPNGRYRKLDCEDPKIVCKEDLNPLHLVPGTFKVPKADI